ncbi:MAG: type II secretion system GspH family protein [Patescibacteria group bacterium]|nr:type II secretion system GspH family protein [Patescibacteria group bacterium]
MREIINSSQHTCLYHKGTGRSDNLSILNSQFSISSAFTLIELLVVISIIAILTAGAIPSFSGFTRSQALIQSFKNLKSDLRVAQSRSLSGAAVAKGGVPTAQAWGVHLTQGSLTYSLFSCDPVATVSQYYQYNFLACTSVGGYNKTVNLGANVKILTLSANPLDVVFDSQNGAIVVNGASISSNVIITLDYSSGGSSPQTITITPQGGISD